jgi:membrane fusion protein (multidrug efflux system)
MRYAAVILGILVLVATLGGIKGAQISSLISAGKKFEAAGPPPEAVSTAIVREEAWEGTLSAVGSIVAVKGVSVSNEAAGTVSRILFESGARVREGQVLVELDTKVERAQLAAARARLTLAEISLQRARSLLATRSIAQAEVDSSQSALDGAAADVRAIEAQLALKVVRAPFAGRLGIRAVNLGQYLAAGTTVTALEAVDPVYADFTLPQQRLASVAVGMPVRVELEGVKEAPRAGTIAAIDPTLDPVTRSIKLRANVRNEDERLRSGMFVNVSVVLPERENAVIAPATAIVHAAYGDSVFMVEDKKDAQGNVVRGADGAEVKVVRQQFVRLGETRGDFVTVREGLAKGKEVVVAGAFKLRNGMAVAVKPDVKPAPELAPHPENR